MVGWGIPVIAQTPIKSDIPEDNFVVAKYVHYEKFNPCSCVSYAKHMTGVSQGVSWGHAGNLKGTRDKPYEGGLVLTNEGKGHIAYIKRIEGDILYITEANYIPCKVSERQININDPIIRGFR